MLSLVLCVTYLNFVCSLLGSHKKPQRLHSQVVRPWFTARLGVATTTCLTQVMSPSQRICPRLPLSYWVSPKLGCIHPFGLSVTSMACATGGASLTPLCVCAWKCLCYAFVVVFSITQKLMCLKCFFWVFFGRVRPTPMLV